MAPSRILGSITADGTVLVINQNGIIFGAGSQINVGSLLASTLDVGPSVLPDPTSATGAMTAATIALRNQNFLANGLLGYEGGTFTLGDGLNGNQRNATFSALGGSNDGTITVENGSEIATSDGGLILLAAPHVVNGGHLASPQGQVILTAAELALTLTPSTGTGTDPIPSVEGLNTPVSTWAASDSDVRGLVPLPQGKAERSDYYVWNQDTGLIEAPEGNIYLRAPGNILNSNAFDNGGGVTMGFGAAYNDGILSATTSVSRNGSIMVDGGDVRLGKGSLISILADTSDETIPQNSDSLAAFKPSAIKIGRNADRIEMQEDASVLAPGANVEFGRSEQTALPNRPQSIDIADGAEINVAGLTDILVPISAMQVVIDPAKQNELRDSPIYRLGFLNGATIYLDPRKSGVRDDGVAWIGSPLIDAKAYYELVGVRADQLMSKGGTVRIGAASYGNDPRNTGNASVIIREGATIDVSGGWVTYQGGVVRSTQLVDQYGHIVDIADADPNRTYVAIASGFTRSSDRWGIVETWANPFNKSGLHYVPEYTEGRDAGVLRIVTNALAFDGDLIGNAYAGSQQIADGKQGTGSSGIEDDERLVQGANSELPAGAALIIVSGKDVIIKDSVDPLADGTYGGWIGGGIDGDGTYSRPTQNSGLPLPADRFNTIQLSDDLLSDSGLSEVKLYGGRFTDATGTTLINGVPGNVTVSADANITLNPGGVFHAEGQHVEVDGDIAIPAGKITLKTIAAPLAQQAAPGDFDIVVNGNLDVAGRWVNDFGVPTESMLGPAWLNGGSIEMDAASAFTVSGHLVSLRNTDFGRPTFDANGNPVQPAPGSWTDVAAEDVSGSILINAGAKLNLSGGGRVDAKGNLDLTAKGGNLSLTSNTAYYTTDITGSGFRVLWYETDDSNVVINPDKINTRIAFDPSSIEAHGFGGGGTFTLVTPEFSLGDGTTDVGSRLPLDFFSKAGFGTYDITSTKTEFAPSKFGFGGSDAYAAVQTIAIDAGQTLSLVQSVLPSILDQQQADGLRSLASGGDVNSVVSAIIPPDAYDQQAVNLKLGGMLELHVAQGGKVIGAAGSKLTVGGLLNEGTIRIPGGTILQDQGVFITGINPTGSVPDPTGFHDLAEIFTVKPDGSIDPNAPSKLKDANGNPIRNGDVVGDNHSSGTTDPFTGRALYKLGLLDQDEGILLKAGSVTDLSGAVLVNPRAVGVNGRAITDGRIVGGGTLGTVAKTQINGVYHAGGSITAEPGAVIDLSGVSGAFDQLGPNGYVRSPVWSDGGTLLVSEGGTFGGATIHAEGGSASANGGTLDFVDPIFTQHDPAAPAENIVSADMIASAGFDTLIARGSITSNGDADVQVDRAFFLLPKAYKYPASSGGEGQQNIISPIISTGGALAIEAPYIGLQNVVDIAAPATGGTPGDGSVTFRGRQIDLTGAVRFDRSVANAVFEASGDIRLIGVSPTALQSFVNPGSLLPPLDNPTLSGMLSVQGDLSLIAAQIYPTTGASFDITSSAAQGTISIGRSGSGEAPPVPYSAGGDLTIQAANIWQGGVIRVPFGSLTLGGNSAAMAGNAVLAPATQSVVLADGSITSVSAGGLFIPYGTTTDTIEWYFSPTGLDALSGPPVKVLSLNGRDISMAAGATVDLTGGGDVYAYEFVPGTGGSRDVLSRFNSDQYSANVINGVGYQYPDARQVYAIVPGLSDAPAAAYDPIYSADYANLSSASGVGSRVYLSGGNGLAAGWYTLLPAQYAMLPGGMRVVEQTGVKSAIPGASTKLADGSLLVSGYYGDALSGATQSTVRQFSVMSQDVIKSYSNIVLTSGNDYTQSQAASKGLVAPRTGLDAGRLVLNPLASMQIDATIAGSAAKGGRGSQVDIASSNMQIVSAIGAPISGVVQLDVDSLNNLNAESLLIGATRTDNTDGTTNLNVTANTIVVSNDAEHPLVAPEIVFAVDDMARDAQGNVSPVASSLTLNDGASVIATGTMNDQRSGAYVVDGRVAQTSDGSTTTYHMPANTAIGALFRVANGPQRLVQRLRSDPDPTLPGNTGSPTGPDSSLVVGNVNVSGGAIGLDTSNNVSVGSNAKLAGNDIALGVTRLAFTDRDPRRRHGRDHAGAAGDPLSGPTSDAQIANVDWLRRRQLQFQVDRLRCFNARSA